MNDPPPSLPMETGSVSSSDPFYSLTVAPPKSNNQQTAELRRAKQSLGGGRKQQKRIFRAKKETSGT